MPSFSPAGVEEGRRSKIKTQQKTGQNLSESATYELGCHFSDLWSESLISDMSTSKINVASDMGFPFRRGIAMKLWTVKSFKWRQYQFQSSFYDCLPTYTTAFQPLRERCTWWDLLKLGEGIISFSFSCLAVLDCSCFWIARSFGHWYVMLFICFAYSFQTLTQFFLTKYTLTSWFGCVFFFSNFPFIASKLSVDWYLLIRWKDWKQTSTISPYRCDTNNMESTCDSQSPQKILNFGNAYPGSRNLSTLVGKKLFVASHRP